MNIKPICNNLFSNTYCLFMAKMFISMCTLSYLSFLTYNALIIMVYWEFEENMLIVVLFSLWNNICYFSWTFKQWMFSNVIQIIPLFFSYISLCFQFVPFRDYIDRSGNQVLSMARLAKDVLAEIPDQLLSFMKSRGIHPRPALPSCPLPELHN